MIERAAASWRTALHPNVLGIAALVAVGCGGHVDLGRSAPSGTPPPVTDDHELNAQTTNLATVDAALLSSLAIDDEFLYFTSRLLGGEAKLWRCQKANCLATLAVIYSPRFVDEYGLRLFTRRLGWQQRAGYGYALDDVEMCDAPDCNGPHLVPGAKFEIWDEDFGYWFDSKNASLDRCPLSNCATGNTVLASSLPTPETALDFALADGRVYWSIDEGILRASVDGSKAAERLTLGKVTEWTSSRLDQESSSDVTVVDMELDGPYVYAALRIGNQNANQTLDCDSCRPGIAVARWRSSQDGAAREWVLSNDADLADLLSLRVFGGEMVWGTAGGELWSCLADRCSTSKRQIGIQNARSVFAPVRQPLDFVAIDEQAIFWLSVPCLPTSWDCISNSSPLWTLKRTPRIPQ